MVNKPEDTAKESVEKADAKAADAVDQAEEEARKQAREAAEKEDAKAAEKVDKAGKK